MKRDPQKQSNPRTNTSHIQTNLSRNGMKQKFKSRFCNLQLVLVLNVSQRSMKMQYLKLKVAISFSTRKTNNNFLYTLSSNLHEGTLTSSTYWSVWLTDWNCKKQGGFDKIRLVVTSQFPVFELDFWWLGDPFIYIWISEYPVRLGITTYFKLQLSVHDCMIELSASILWVPITARRSCVWSSRVFSVSSLHVLPVLPGIHSSVCCSHSLSDQVN